MQHQLETKQRKTKKKRVSWGAAYEDHKDGLWKGRSMTDCEVIPHKTFKWYCGQHGVSGVFTKHIQNVYMSKIFAGSNIDRDLKSTHDALKPGAINGKINDTFNQIFLRNNVCVKGGKRKTAKPIKGRIIHSKICIRLYIVWLHKCTGCIWWCKFKW